MTLLSMRICPILPVMCMFLCNVDVIYEVLTDDFHHAPITLFYRSVIHEVPQGYTLSNISPPPACLEFFTIPTILIILQD
jgi:hypothetical protein